MHLVETMAFRGATPWHGLGSRLEANQSIEVWQQQSGLSFELREAPVQFNSGRDDGTSTTQPFPQQKVLYRSDTKVPLSVVSSRYQVVQPKEILEFYRDLTEVSGFELETAGVLKGGRKLWALAKTGQSAELKGNDLMHGYLLLATACDGTLATTAQFTSIRVVCNNTLAIALVDGKGAVRVPHNTRFNAQEVKRQLGISVLGWDRFIISMQALSERKVTSGESLQYFRHLFAGPDELSGKVRNEQAMEAAHMLYEGAGRGADLASAKGTAFGLLNAVTEYVDFEKRSRSNDNRLDSAWFGSGAALKQKALQEALSMIS